MNDRILLATLIVLGAALMLCLGGIVYLAAAIPARAIPDVLVATSGGIVGAIAGILAPTRR